MSFGPFVFVCLIRAHARSRLVHCVELLGSLGSIGFVWYIRVRPRDLWVHLRSLLRALGVVGFIRVRLVNLDPLGCA